LCSTSLRFGLLKSCLRHCPRGRGSGCRRHSCRGEDGDRDEGGKERARSRGVRSPDGGELATPLYERNAARDGELEEDHEMVEAFRSSDACLAYRGSDPIKDPAIYCYTLYRISTSEQHTLERSLTACTPTPRLRCLTLCVECATWIRRHAHGYRIPREYPKRTRSIFEASSSSGCGLMRCRCLSMRKQAPPPPSFSIASYPAQAPSRRCPRRCVGLRLCVPGCASCEYGVAHYSHTTRERQHAITATSLSIQSSGATPAETRLHSSLSSAPTQLGTGDSLGIGGKPSWPSGARSASWTDVAAAANLLCLEPIPLLPKDMWSQYDRNVFKL
jgi:hypothetical protein